MAKKKQPAKPKASTPSQRAPVVWIVVLALIVITGGVALWWANGAALSPTPAPPSQLGGVTSCRRLPGFVAAQGFDPATAALSTSDDRRMGLLLIEPDGAGGQRVYQHPSWDDAGWLGGVALDERGNVYVVPAPRISLFDNPPAAHTRLYRVDTDTGVLSVLLELPAAAPVASTAPSQTNPYGLMGVTYDCETASLYVSSIAGSSRTAEVGRLFRIDVSGAQPKIAAQFEGVDAIGLGVFNGAKDKRLYFGSARTSEIRSVALDTRGDFFGGARVDFSLAEHDPRGDDKARRLTFSEAAGLRVDALKFNYNLVASSEHRQNMYRYAYDSNTDGWVFLEVRPVLKGGD